MPAATDATFEQHNSNPPIKVLGFIIPVSLDGRRMWTVEFKEEIKRKLAEREMTPLQIATACGVSTKTVHKWKTFPPRKVGRPLLQRPKPEISQEDRISFVELGIAASQSKESGELRLTFKEFEVSFPGDYPPERLAQLIMALDAAT